MVERGSSLFVVSAEAQIPAPAERIYHIIADYRHGHPLILPRHFSNLSVLQGGIGAGTRIRFSMKILGRHQHFEADITEPEPGRVLAEHSRGAPPSVTTFIVDAVASGKPARTQVTIRTEMSLPAGWLGGVRRFMTRRLLQSIYRAELARLAAVAVKDQPSEVRTARV